MLCWRMCSVGGGKNYAKEAWPVSELCYETISEWGSYCGGRGRVLMSVECLCYSIIRRVERVLR